MAGTINFTVELAVTNGQLTANQSLSTTATQTTPGVLQVVQNIGTSEEAVDLSALTAARFITIKNIDDTNYVELGPDSTGIIDLIQLLPGESCGFPLKPSVTLKAQANTAPVDISIMAAET